ncbi:organic cation transporter protein-like [Leguminivora glycinivorella]|uniref:organic cation transporter protein-like n=1 Tax=Leguminivora glycinivorella TaxID=1035111 RepID=UPI00200E4BE3|nr:organic cation transporter protein-like [Leguminivora glycinivorella]
MNAPGEHNGKAEEKEKEKERVHLDTILKEIGEFGSFQRRALGLALLVALLSGYSANEYVFTAARITTRCLIPECESSGDPNWLTIAIPQDGGFLDNCNRFNSTLQGNTTCSADHFDRDVIMPCEEYVYENTDTVVYEFNLACQEWRRSIIGSASMFGMMLALPLTGFISDRYGRRFALALNAFNHSWLGLARYWTQSYESFIAFEFLEALFGAAGFTCAYIIAMEFVGPKYRVLAGATTSTFFTIGLIMQALMAWAVPYWRHLTLALYIPQLITITYFFIMPESVRWYLSKGRYTEAEAQLKKAAKINKKTLSEESLRSLKQSSEEERMMSLEKKKEPWLISLVFQHKPILLRCIIAPVWWITTVLIYYGLSMNAVNMSGNKYLNYIAVGAMEIPGSWTAVLLFDRIGRKPLFVCAFWLCAACQIGFIFMPDGFYGVSLAVYLIGKYSISIVVTSLYIFTNELFPTRHRSSLFAFSSMVGRVGSITAALTPALASMVWEQLPFVLFGSLAALSGCLVLLAPETKGTTLPDTMEEASRLGSKKQSTPNS